MRMASFVTIVIFYLCLLASPVSSASEDDTFVFAVSACPPWKTKLLEDHAKNIAYACQNNVEVFTTAIKEALDVPPENIFIHVDEQATYSRVEKGLKELADKVPENARVIMLFSFHGNLTDITDTEESGQKDEVLVLWTEEKPFTILSAITLKQWITARDLRQMIDAVRAEEIIIAVDACHSGQAVPDILKKHGRDSDWQGREAVMASSRGDQFSYFTVDGSYGVFTLSLTDSIRMGSLTAQQAFDNSVNRTITYIESYQEKCSKMLWEVMGKKARCEQTPISYDPTNLLSSIKLMTKDTGQ